MTQYDDPLIERTTVTETDPIEVAPADTPVKVYDRPTRRTPVWLLLLIVVLALVTMWFLFSYVF